MASEKPIFTIECPSFVVHEGTPVVFGEAQENRPADVVQWWCHLSMRIRVGKVGL
jgi:hypothetical protein